MEKNKLVFRGPRSERNRKWYMAPLVGCYVALISLSVVSVARASSASTLMLRYVT